MHTPSPSDRERILAEGAKLFIALHPPRHPLWRRRLKAMWTGLGRDYTVELAADFVLRVRDHRTGEVLCESLPGQPLNIAHEVPHGR